MELEITTSNIKVIARTYQNLLELNSGKLGKEGNLEIIANNDKGETKLHNPSWTEIKDLYKSYKTISLKYK